MSPPLQWAAMACLTSACSQMSSVTGQRWEWGSLRQASLSILSCLRTGCPVCCPVLVPMPLFHPYHTHHASSAQKGKEKKKAKYDSLQDLRKNKKELEFEQKLFREKEEMLEKEKQLKINRLAQEVCAQSRDSPVPARLPTAHSLQISPTQGHLRSALG